MTIVEIVLMKPHESPRINKKSNRGDSRDSWPVWNRGIKEIMAEEDLEPVVIGLASGPECSSDNDTVSETNICSRI